jgi:hypothetical protein
MPSIVNKTVNLNLVGLDGNAFNLLGQFQKQARKEGWTQDEIKAVMDEAQSGDYDHLLQTLMDHTNFDDIDEDDFWDEDDEDDDF